jgi:hypothetical protein
MSTARRRTWVWHFERPPAEIWPIMADTARFNEAAALPKHDIEEIPQADGSVLYLGRLKRGPITLVWQEKRSADRRPVVQHCRVFRNGPAESWRAFRAGAGKGRAAAGLH